MKKSFDGLEDELFPNERRITDFLINFEIY